MLNLPFLLPYFEVDAIMYRALHVLDYRPTFFALRFRSTVPRAGDQSEGCRAAPGEQPQKAGDSRCLRDGCLHLNVRVAPGDITPKLAGQTVGEAIRQKPGFFLLSWLPSVDCNVVAGRFPSSKQSPTVIECVSVCVCLYI